VRFRDSADDLNEPAGSLLSFLRCLGANSRSIVYVSAPITTGRRYLQWRSVQDRDKLGTSLDASHRREVIQRNLEAASNTVQRVRAKFNSLVVDPTQLEDVPDWKQADYHRFWVALIETYAKTVVFVDGWEYSTGCSLELMAAYRNSLEVLDQGFRPLSAKKAAELLGEAVSEFRSASISVSILARLAEEVQTFADDYSPV
jgi:hypothetical protein